MVYQSTVSIDTDRRKVVVAARRRLLEAGAREAARIAENVDPDDRDPQQVELMEAVSAVIRGGIR